MTMLSGPEEELKKHIENIKKSAATSAQKSSSPSTALGHAPPCKTYELLVTFDTLQAATQDIFDCQSKAEIAEKKKSIAAMKATCTTTVMVGSLDSRFSGQFGLMESGCSGRDDWLDYSACLPPVSR